MNDNDELTAEEQAEIRRVAAIPWDCARAVSDVMVAHNWPPLSGDEANEMADFIIDLVASRE